MPASLGGPAERHTQKRRAVLAKTILHDCRRRVLCGKPDVSSSTFESGGAHDCAFRAPNVCRCLAPDSSGATVF